MAEQVTTGTVALMSAALARYAASAQCLLALERPPGTRVEWFSGSVDVPLNRNMLAGHFLGDWLLMIDDDQLFTPDLLIRLLRHFDNDAVDVVVPLILKKKPPHDPALAAERDGSAALWSVPLTDQRGLQPVDAAGTGVMLVRRRVFERVAHPWFERNGTIGNDYYFCQKARAAGCGVYCDFDTLVGHIFHAAIWPARLPNGRWGSTFVHVPLGDMAACNGRVAIMAREAAAIGSVPGVQPYAGVPEPETATVIRSMRQTIREALATTATGGT